MNPRRSATGGDKYALEIRILGDNAWLRLGRHERCSSLFASSAPSRTSQARRPTLGLRLVGRSRRDSEPHARLIRFGNDGDAPQAFVRSSDIRRYGPDDWFRSVVVAHLSERSARSTALSLFVRQLVWFCRSLYPYTPVAWPYHVADWGHRRILRSVGK